MPSRDEGGLCSGWRSAGGRTGGWCTGAPASCGSAPESGAPPARGSASDWAPWLVASRSAAEGDVDPEPAVSEPGPGFADPALADDESLPITGRFPGAE